MRYGNTAQVGGNSYLPSSLTERVPIWVMVRLWNLSSCKHCTQNRSSALCWKLTINKLMRNGILTKFHEVVNGRIIIIKLQVCVDPHVFEIPTSFPPQSVPEKLCIPRRSWHLWCPITWIRLNISTFHFFDPFPVENFRSGTCNAFTRY